MIKKIDLICAINVEELDDVNNQFEVFCRSERDVVVSSKLRVCALLMEYKKDPDKNFRYTFVSNSASIKSTSDQLEYSGNSDRSDSQTLSKEDAVKFTSLCLSASDKDSEVLKFMKNYIEAER